MKLAIFGGDSQTGRQFVDHAKKQGFTVIQTSDIQDDAVAAHAIICLPDFDLNAARLGAIVDRMEACGIRRLVIASSILSHNHDLRVVLRPAAIDWTIVHTMDEAEQIFDQAAGVKFLVGAKDVAKFLVNQITDSRYLRTTVLVRN